MTKPHHALSNAIQIIHQRWRDVGGIESRLVGIADDGTMGIVACNDNETVFSDISKLTNKKYFFILGQLY